MSNLPDIDPQQPHAVWGLWLIPKLDGGANADAKWKALDGLADKWAQLKPARREYARDQVAITSLAVAEFMAGQMVALREALHNPTAPGVLMQKLDDLIAQQERTNQLLQALVAAFAPADGGP